MVTLQQDVVVDAVEARTDHMAYPMVDLNETNAALGKNFATPDDLDAELELLKDELEDETDVWADDVVTHSHLTGVPCHRHQMGVHALPTILSRTLKTDIHLW